MKQSNKIDQNSLISNVLDYVWWTVLVVFLVGIVVLNQIFRDQAILLKGAGSIVAFIAAFGIFCLTKSGKDFWVFAKATKIEFLKIVWPTQDEANKVTVAVIAAVTALSLILWLFDAFFYLLIRQVTG